MTGSRQMTSLRNVVEHTASAIFFFFFLLFGSFACRCSAGVDSFGFSIRWTTKKGHRTIQAQRLAFSNFFFPFRVLTRPSGHAEVPSVASEGLFLRARFCSYQSS